MCVRTAYQTAAAAGRWPVVRGIAPIAGTCYHTNSIKE